MVLSVASLLKPCTDRLWNALFHWWDDAEGREICQAALDRIHDEKHKFEHILAEKPYNNAGHEKAFTQSSFELLGKAMSKLAYVRKFRHAAMEVARRCEQRDAAGVFVLIDKLEPRLAQRCGH